MLLKEVIIFFIVYLTKKASVHIFSDLMMCTNAQHSSTRWQFIHES